MLLPFRSISIVLLAAFAYTLPASAQSTATDDPYASIDHDVSFEKEVKPILREKCMGCHACYDSPAQMNFTNAFGVQRGAARIDPFAVRLKAAPFFKLAHTDKSIEDFRKLGFFSVIEGGKDSIMAKMIRQAYDPKHRWKANEPIPDYIEIDSITHKLTAANEREIDGYLISKPRQGMPFAIAGLDPEEYTTLMTWLEQGAKFDATEPQPTAADTAAINDWEAFLNQPDNEHRLVARYMFEHMYGYHFFFDKDSSNFFAMVRSKTPPGQPVKPISTRHGNSPVEGDFWYRFAIVDVVLHAKRHVPVDCTNNELEVYKSLLFEQPFTVDKLPGYSQAERHNMLTTFAAIPAKSRYKFLLHDAFYQERVVSTGPSCRGAMNVSMTLEHFWYLYENPETSLICNDQEYYDAVAPVLGSMTIFTGVPQMVDTMENQVSQTRHAYELAVEKLKKNPRSAITDIWGGSDFGGMPALTSMRHDDNTYQVPGLAGGFPDRCVVSDLVGMERRIYLASTNYDTFTGVGDLMSIRMDFSNARLRTELSYLRFLPQDAREAELGKLYKLGAKDPQVMANLPADLDFPSQIQYKTDNCREEFMAKVVEHLRGKAPVDDAIYRPGKDQQQPSETIKAMRLIGTKADELRKAGVAGFKQYLDSHSVIRIESDTKAPYMYSMCVNWDIGRLSYAGEIFERPPVKYDTVMVLDGVTGAFPNYMFNVKESEVMEFATALTDAGTEEKFLDVNRRWGVARTNPKFWQIFHSMEAFVRSRDPRSAALLDCSRYTDYSKENMPKRNMVDPRLESPSLLSKNSDE